MKIQWKRSSWPPSFLRDLYRLNLMLSRFPRLWKRPLPLAGVLAGVAALVGLLVWISLPGVPAFAIKAGDQVIGVAADRAAAGQAVQMASASDISGSTFFRDKISIEQVRASQEEIQPPAALAERLRGQVPLLVNGAGIVINGALAATLASQEDAGKALQMLRERYSPGRENMTVEEAAFAETVEIKPNDTPAAEILTAEQAVEILARGTLARSTYVVREGQSLWTIARANRLTVEELQAANPQLKTDLLQPGQEISLIKPEPLLHYRVAYREKDKEVIQAPVRYSQDSGLWRGQERVREAGKPGSKEVLYSVMAVNGQVTDRQKLSETVLENPSPRVVARGTKAMVASRGGGGNGQLAWPLRGTITSPFGRRGREFHTGVDIDGETGDPVFAAEEGKVIYAGWNGNYGRLVAIDHGDGLVSRYSHLSAFKLGVGDTVKRGDLVGLVGSSGRTTGSHLHFEVLVNGAFKNPLNYLR